MHLFRCVSEKRENAVFHDGFDVQVMEYTILKFLSILPLIVK